MLQATEHAGAGVPAAKPGQRGDPHLLRRNEAGHVKQTVGNLLFATGDVSVTAPAMLAISAQSEEHARAAALKKATSVTAKATKTLQLETELRDAAAKLDNENEKNIVLVCTCKAYLKLLRRRADVLGNKQLFAKCASVAKLGTGTIQEATLAILAHEREPPQ
jgi:hypothetical protein